MTHLSIENVSFAYHTENESIPVLKNVSLSIASGDFVAIRGRSGSGKSTLFHLIGCLLRPSSGKIYLEGTDLTTLSNDALAFIRNRKIAFIFQQFHLLARSTVLDNILLPTLYPADGAESATQARKRAIACAEKVGLSHRLEQMPNQLSGGEQQRVVIARALMSNAPLILADEPTGNLDTKNAENIMTLLRELNREGKTVLVITHDPEIAKQCNREYEMSDGEFVSRPVVSETSRVTRLAATPSPSFGTLFKSAFPLALQNLRRNKIRALLTMFGVLIGISAVFAMLTFGRFAKEKVMKGYEELGANTLMIHGRENWKRKATDKVDIIFDQFDWEKDILPLKNIFPQIKYISPIISAWGNTITYGGVALENEVVTLGVNEYMLSITKRPIQYGKGFSPYQIENKSPVCLIGNEIATNVFRGVNPIGKIAFVSRNEQVAFPCQVIGVLAKQTSMKDWRKPNLEVILPYTYSASVYEAWNSEINSFITQLEDGSDIEHVASGIKNFFSQKYGKAGEFNVNSDTKLIGQMKKSLGLFTVLLTTIALITLSVGGIGINNMMLVSVTERFKEIGLRKAVGATDRSIRAQFLLEAVILAAFAGFFGVLLGFIAYEGVIYGTSKVVAQLPFEWVLDPFPLAVSLVSILAVGILSGIVPAIKAERLQVIEALRSE
jgi:macrolide transport system ATP-binding/permease protein